MPANQSREERHAAGGSAYEIDEIERIKAWYAAECDAGRLPDMRVYLERYPDYADELRDYVVYLHTIAVDLPAPAAVPAAELSPAARSVLTRMAAEGVAAQVPTMAQTVVRVAETETLVSRAGRAGVKPIQLVAKVGINIDILTRLQNGLIAPGSVPRTLIQRIAAVIAETPATVETLLGLNAPAQSAFFYSNTAPEHSQDTFLDAVQKSALSEEQKQEWRAIVADDFGEKS